MTVRDDLLSAARNLLIAVTGATDDKVIDSGKKGPRPFPPYASVRVLTPGGATHGPAERINGLDGGGDPQATMRQRREATISVQGFGSSAGDWLDQMQSDIDSPDSLTQQAADGIAALILTPASDVSQLLDTAEESRFSLDLVFRYTWLGVAQAQTELLTAAVGVELARYDGDADTLDASFVAP